MRGIRRVSGGFKGISTMSKTVAAGIVGLTALLAAGLSSEARAQQHWFYGNYGYYDGQEYYQEPEPRYVPQRGYRSYQPAYPRPWFWRSRPRNEIVEYEVAPNEWVRVYPDGSQESIEGPSGQRQAAPARKQRTKEAVRQQRPQAVPVPKAKPTTTARTLGNTETALLAPDQPMIDEELPAAEVPPVKAPLQQTATRSPSQAPEAEAKEPASDKIATGSLKAVSCEEAQRIVSDFGFSDVKPRTCAGKVYDIDATRDGKPYTIKLSAADGELTEVKKR